MRIPSRILPALWLAFPLSARADITVGPYTFANAALIDGVTQVEGATWANGWLDGLDSHPFPYSFETLVAAQWDDIIFLGATDLGADMVFEATFVDNVVVNGPGADLILFDAIDASGYDIAVATVSGYTAYVSYPSASAIDINVENPYWWWGPNGSGLIWLNAYAIEIDLSDFGLAEGSVASAFRFRGEGADPLGAGALNSAAPLPTKSVTWGSVKAMYR